MSSVGLFADARRARRFWLWFVQLWQRPGFRIALAALVLTLPMLPAASQRVLAAGPRLRLENRDGAPYSDWLVMSRIQNPEDGTRKCFAPAPADCFIQPNVVHDVATLRLHNDGDQPLTISALEVNGQFVLVVPPALPASGRAGAISRHTRPLCSAGAGSA